MRDSPDRSTSPTATSGYGSSSNLSALTGQVINQHAAISSSSSPKPRGAFIDEESLLLPAEEQKFIEDELKKLAASPKGFYKRLIAGACFLCLATLAYTTSPYSHTSVSFSTATTVSKEGIAQLDVLQEEMMSQHATDADASSSTTSSSSVLGVLANDPAAAMSNTSTKSDVDNNAIEQAFFAGIDSNKDDKISKEEFMKFTENTNGAKNLEGLRHMRFEQIDRDGDDHISSQDFHIFLKSTGDAEVLKAVHDVAITAYTISK